MDAAPTPAFPKCNACGMRHPAPILVTGKAPKPDPMLCIRALSEMVTGLTLALGGDAGPLNVVVQRLYGEG